MVIIQKKIKQYYYNNPRDLTIGKDILEGLQAYKLGIHALPGTEFSISSDFSSSFKIGPTGNYSLDCSEYPIKHLYLKQFIKHSEQNMYPIIVDVEYMEVSNNV